MKEPPRDLIAVGVAVLILVRPEVTAEQLTKAFGSTALPAAEEPCARFWRDWAHNALVEFGDTLMSALHVSVQYSVARPCTGWVLFGSTYARGEWALGQRSNELYAWRA